MVLKKASRTLAELFESFKSKGHAAINAEHVKRILDKIDRQERKILGALERATDPAKRDRLTRKLGVIEQQRKRGEELLGLVRDDGG